MGTALADAALATTLAGLPEIEHGHLMPSGRPASVPFERISDAAWLDSEVALQASRWPSVNRRVRATLWWYSVSQVFLTPTVASLFVAGRALSPKPGDVLLQRADDGVILTAQSIAVLDGDPVEATAAALRESLEFAIPLVARAGAGGKRALWAIASDSLANRMLWLGRVRGEVDRATALAVTLADLIGSPLPTPRYLEVPLRAPKEGNARFVRRSSCCLIYFEPDVPKCASCPRHTPAERGTRLRDAADYI